MSYIESNLQPGEQVKYRARIHFFLFARPVILLLLGWIFYCVDVDVSAFVHYGGMFLLFLGTVSLFQRLMVKIGSAYAVTDKRLILKTGVISRRTGELLLAKCEGLHIRQSVWGRIFNFGTISVTTGGVTNSYPFIADPLRFRREINAQIG